MGLIRKGLCQSSINPTFHYSNILNLRKVQPMEKKVLIVDDEERVVQSITGVLEDEGFRVATARSGEEAIGIFQQEEPDVTLLDIWMPGMDGIEVLKGLKWFAPGREV